MKGKFLLIPLLFLAVVFFACEKTEEIPTYTLSLEANISGAGTFSGEGEYEAGESVSVSVTTNEGFVFINWTNGETQVSEVESFTFTMPNTNTTLSANFEEISYALETIAQGKKNLENTGIEIIDELRILRDSEAMDAMEVMVHFMGQGNPFGAKTFASTPFFKPFKPLVGVKNGKYGPSHFFKSMMLEDEDIYGIQDLFNEFVGIYSWNSSLGDWEKISASDKIEFRFPSTENGTTNDASITITYEGTTQYPSLIPDYNGDLPKNFKISFKVGSVTHIEYTLAFEYHSDGVPSSIVTSLKVSSFEFSAAWSHSSQNVGVLFGIKNGTKVLVEAEFSSNGVYDINEIETIIDNNGDVDDIIHTANFRFRVLDIQFLSEANIKELIKAERNIYANSWNDNFDYVAADKLWAAALNDYTNVVVMYASTNKWIAVGEWYQYDVTETWWEYQWTHSYVEMRFVFADDSRVDMETYFGSGFGDLVSEMNKFIAELNNKYGIDIDDIDYK